MGPNRRYSIGLQRCALGLYSKLVFICPRFSKLPTGQLLILSIFIAAAGMEAAVPNRVSYDIHFTATRGVAPTDGSFVYDSSTQSFSNFEVAWRGLVFDLTSSANSPTNRAARRQPLELTSASIARYGAKRSPVASRKLVLNRAR